MNILIKILVTVLYVGMLFAVADYAGFQPAILLGVGLILAQVTVGYASQ